MFKTVIKVFFFIFIVWALSYPFIQQDVFEEKPIVENKEIKGTLPKTVIEQPLHSVDLPDFKSIKNVVEKKHSFFDFLKPYVVNENKQILVQRTKISTALKLVKSGQPLTQLQVQQLQLLLVNYKIKYDTIDESCLTKALKRVDILPQELVLIQAANESAWGTSRFARIGLNFFGQWCYSKGCGMVPKGRNSGARHEVAAFQSVQSAVSSYFRNINTHNAYENLRQIRSSLREQNKPIDATELTQGLLSYSQRGGAYVSELNEMIRHNSQYFK